MKPFSPSSEGASDRDKATSLTAVTVMKDGTNYALCPFFGKCDGILVVDPIKVKVVYIDNTGRTPEGMCGTILESGATRLICGFVPEAERKKLQAAGLDVRLGSCACAVDQLVTEFDTLPKA